MKSIPVLFLTVALALPGASAADTVSCDGKRGWQRDIVRQTVYAWILGIPDPDHLVQLVQAEHGIVACASSARPPHRLHTTSLQRGLELQQLGAVLLANELEWSGLMPPPEEGLVGEFFRVQKSEPVHDLAQGVSE